MALREGYTTGTAAAAAAKAGVMVLLGLPCPDKVDTPLPSGERLAVPVARCERPAPPGAGRSVRVVVIKDGGDDPDVTDGAEIHCLVQVVPGARGGHVELLAGEGVGTVTLPGLPVPPGQPAINPAPRAQILAAAQEALDQAGRVLAVRLTVEAPQGEALAARTMNPRLGIVGGISILGTRGTVKPFSHASWTASIELAMDVARAQGLTRLALATGGRTARLAAASRPDIARLAVVQLADFFAHSLRAAAARGFGEIVVACFFGKLVKMAQGLEYTHAKAGDMDFLALAALARQAGLPEPACAAMARARTAAHVLALAKEAGKAKPLLGVVAERAMAAARGFAGPGPVLEYRVYSMDQTPLLVLRSEENAL